MKGTGRMILVLLIVVMAGFSLIACSDSSGSKKLDRDTQEQEKSTSKNVTISIMINQTWNKPSMETLAKKYEDENKNIKIDYQVIPDNEFSQLLNSKIASREVPEIVMDNYQSLARAVNMKDTFVDLKDQPWVNRLVNFDSMLIDGNMYLLPINGSGGPFGIVYNDKVYKDNNIQVPKTYDEFLDVCEKLKSAGVIPVAITGNDDWTVGMWVVTMFPNAVYDKPDAWDKLNTGKMKFSEVKDFEKALDILNDLIAKDYVNKDYLATTYDMGQQMISEGKAAMTLQGDWFISECLNKYPDVKFGMYPFPSREDPRFASGQFSGFNVFKDGKNSREALKFLEFVAQAENMAMISKDWNHIPPFSDVVTDLPYWLQDVKDNYIAKGRAPIPEMAITSIIECGYLTDLTMDMIAGGQSAKEVLENWDKKFEELAKLRRLPGWD